MSGPRGGGTRLEFSSVKVPGQIPVRTTGRGHSTGIFLRKGARSDICQYHGAGALDWNFPPQRCPVRYMSGPWGGVTGLELSSAKVPGQIYVRTTGRGHSTGTFLHKGARSDICQDRGAGALIWNATWRGYFPRGGGTQLELLSLRLPSQRSVRTTGRGH